ncbi:hypothetical protein E5288_WYG022238 [Bos mutus]|uniref:Homeobox domain-containing protein n=1 Tax=Bos mutus TaxID=72004 RepID=A0A6B0S7A6_9CETA|nr:hypothetical protein [Bos mutus]
MGPTWLMGWRDWGGLEAATSCFLLSLGRQHPVLDPIGAQRPQTLGLLEPPERDENSQIFRTQRTTNRGLEGDVGWVPHGLRLSTEAFVWVKIWFQNRRNKWKRQLAAELEAASLSPPGTQRLVRVPVLYHESPPAAGAAAAAALPFPLAPAAPAPPPPSLGFSGALAYPLAAFPAAASAPFLRAQMPGLV